MMYDDAGTARNTTAPTSSSGSPRHPSGTRPRNLRHPLRVVEQRPVHLGPEPAGHHRVDADAVHRPLGGEVPGHRRDGPLGPAINRVAPPQADDPPAQRRDVHDAPLAACDHVPADGAGHQKRPTWLTRITSPSPPNPVGQREASGDPGVVDQDVDAPPFGQRGDGPLDRLGIGHVASEAPRPPALRAAFLGRNTGPLRVAIGEDNPPRAGPGPKRSPGPAPARLRSPAPPAPSGRTANRPRHASAGPPASFAQHGTRGRVTSTPSQQTAPSGSRREDHERDNRVAGVEQVTGTGADGGRQAGHHVHGAGEHPGVLVADVGRGRPGRPHRQVVADERQAEQEPSGRHVGGRRAWPESPREASVMPNGADGPTAPARIAPVADEADRRRRPRHGRRRRRRRTAARRAGPTVCAVEDGGGS